MSSSMRVAVAATTAAAAGAFLLGSNKQRGS